MMYLGECKNTTPLHQGMGWFYRLMFYWGIHQVEYNRCTEIEVYLMSKKVAVNICPNNLSVMQVGFLQNSSFALVEEILDGVHFNQNTKTGILYDSLKFYRDALGIQQFFSGEAIIGICICPIFSFSKSAKECKNKANQIAVLMLMHRYYSIKILTCHFDEIFKPTLIKQILKVKHISRLYKKLNNFYVNKEIFRINT